MKFIRAFLFTLNIILWVAIVVCLFVACDVKYGLAGLAGVIAFFIGYSVSGGMTISILDLYNLPEIEVFKKKIRYGNTWGFIVLMVIALVTHITWPQ